MAPDMSIWCTKQNFLSIYKSGCRQTFHYTNQFSALNEMFLEFTLGGIQNLIRHAHSPHPTIKIGVFYIPTTTVKIADFYVSKNRKIGQFYVLKTLQFG